MANMFNLILFILTLVTGLLWCLDKFVSILKRQDNQIIIQKNSLNKFLEKEFLNKVKLKCNWLKNGASIFPILLIVLIIRSFIYEPFQIPSSSMMPTLLIGDFILVEKFAYGIKDSIFQKTLIKTGHPKRGDIIVFKYPGDPRLDYIKRTIGLPGDKVTYDPIEKKINIQPGCSFGVSCKNTLPITYSNIEPSNFVQTFLGSNSWEENINSVKLPELSQDKMQWNGIRLSERQETIGDITHRILMIPVVQDQIEMYYQQPGQQLASWIISPGHYFVMGDNRDNSSDSRFWGFVPEENLVGKAIAIWISFEKQEGRWPTNVRLNRIGKIY